jgi:hypothetical protein
MQLHIDRRGQICCVYGELIDLHALGELAIRRASHVEPDEHGRWWVDLSPCGGPKLGPFDQRSAALQAEQDWLEQHWPHDPQRR